MLNLEIKKELILFSDELKKIQLVMNNPLLEIMIKDIKYIISNNDEIYLKKHLFEWKTTINNLKIMSNKFNSLF